MKIFITLILSSLFLTFNACKKGAGTVHIHGNGATPKINDVATFDFTLKKDTSIIFSTVQQGRLAQEPISDPNNSEDPMPKFFMKSLMSMHVGDSTSFTLPLDSLRTPSTGLGVGKNATLSIALRKVQSEMEFIATLPIEQQKKFNFEKKKIMDAKIARINQNHSNVISGITPTDIILNFESKNFKTDRNLSSKFSTFDLSLSEQGLKYDVSLICENGGVNDITAIDLHVERENPLSTSVEDMKPFLKYGCSTIIKNEADLIKVKSFIDKNYFKDGASTTISGIKFTLAFKSEFTRLLVIETEDLNSRS